MNDTVEKLEMLANLYAQRDLLPLHKKEAIAQALPPEMVKALEDIEAEFSDTEQAVANNIAALEAEIKAAVIVNGSTIKGTAFMAVWNKGRVSWDSKLLDGFLMAHPELEKARKVGEPSVTPRKVG